MRCAQFEQYYVLNNTSCEKAARKTINIICDIVAWPTNAECSCVSHKRKRKNFFGFGVRNSGHRQRGKKF